MRKITDADRLQMEKNLRRFNGLPEEPVIDATDCVKHYDEKIIDSEKIPHKTNKNTNMEQKHASSNSKNFKINPQIIAYAFIGIVPLIILNARQKKLDSAIGVIFISVVEYLIMTPILFIFLFIILNLVLGGIRGISLVVYLLLSGLEKFGISLESSNDIDDLLDSVEKNMPAIVIVFVAFIFPWVMLFIE